MKKEPFEACELISRVIKRYGAWD